MPRRPRRTTGRTRPRVERRAPTPPDGHEAPAPPQALDVHVDLAGHTVRLAELRARPERYRIWFARARHRPGHARCLCSHTGERLVIRQRAERYHLARWPQASDNHRPGCPFRTAESRQPRAAGVRAAITVTEHGTRIAVGHRFTTDRPEPDDHTGEPGARAADETGADEAGAAGVAGAAAGELAGGRRPDPAMTGTGLLHWLWDSAGLSTWPDPTPAAPDPTPPPGSDNGAAAERWPSAPGRGWSEVHAALLPVLAQLRLGEQPAPTLLHVVAPYRPGRPDPAREARLAEFLRPLEHPEHSVIRGGPRRGHTRLVRHRRLLLAEAKDLTDTEHGHKLTLRHFPRPVFLTTEQLDNLARRFPAVFSAHPGPGARRIVLALVEASPHGHLRLVDAAAMLTTHHYLPAEPG